VIVFNESIFRAKGGQSAEDVFSASPCGSLAAIFTAHGGGFTDLPPGIFVC
jgi:hypothetical protein